MQATWPETVQTGSAVLIGAMDLLNKADQLLVASVEGTRLTGSTSNSCRNCLVVRPVGSLVNALRAAQEGTRMVSGKAAQEVIATSNHGRKVRRVPLPLGNGVVRIVATITTKAAVPLPRHGLVGVTTTTAAMEVRLAEGQHHGNDKTLDLLHLQRAAISTVDMADTQAATAAAVVVVTVASKIWDRLRAWVALVAWVPLLALVHCSKTTVGTGPTVVVHHLHLRRMMLLRHR